jgi:hypothetical protein
VKSFRAFDQELAEAIGLNKSTARSLGLVIITKTIAKAKAVRQAQSLEEKIDRLSDLVLSASYISVLALSMDQNDASLVRKIVR